MDLNAKINGSQKYHAMHCHMHIKVSSTLIVTHCTMGNYTKHMEWYYVW